MIALTNALMEAGMLRTCAPTLPRGTGSSAAGLVPLLIIGAPTVLMILIWSLLSLKQKFSSEDLAKPSKDISPSPLPRPQRVTSRTDEQVVGRICAVCDRRIVFPDDGHWCMECPDEFGWPTIAVHRHECERRHNIDKHSGDEHAGPYR